MLPQEGFAIVPGPFVAGDLDKAVASYDSAVATARSEDRKVGSTSVRVSGLLDRAPELALILTCRPLLEAAETLIGGPFRLSSFHSRSIRPGAATQALHQDVAPGHDGWPLLGFIFMVDASTIENGATLFLPGSARLPMLAAQPDATDLACACGPSGALILFDGSLWHGHGANRTQRWRRSVQGALIPRAATAAVDHRSYLRPEVWSSLPGDVRSMIE